MKVSTDWAGHDEIITHKNNTSNIAHFKVLVAKFFYIFRILLMCVQVYGCT